MEIEQVSTQPYADQKPGTSGLRKKVKVFQQPHYLANFVQAIVDVLPADQRQCLIVGGDGRFFNREAVQIITEILVGNGIKHIIIGADGILSTPAVSHLIRKMGANGGIVLSASHNPGGPDEDFGIKFNNASGSPAPESVTSAIHAATLTMQNYKRCALPALTLRGGQEQQFLGSTVEVVDSVDDYAELMQTLFDFDFIADSIKRGKLDLTFDAMHAVTGPYARRIFGDLLKIDNERLLNCDPLEDFGGGHPDPNRVYAKTLYDFMLSAAATPLGAASDGDGDRNMIMGKGMFVSPSDSLALIAQHHEAIPQFHSGLIGVARSMPTSTAVDRVAASLNIPCYETPTGWKFFGNLLDDERVRLCGEESFGTSGDHVREKDGVWTVLCWLSILASRRKTVAELLTAHWSQFGRSYYCRHDYDGLSAEHAEAIMSGVPAQASSIVGRQCGSKTVAEVNVFDYHDPVDASVSSNQGVRVIFDDASRIVYRLSGTGTGSATLRVYLEQLERDQARQQADAIAFNETLGQFANDIAGVERIAGLADATVKT